MVFSARAQKADQVSQCSLHLGRDEVLQLSQQSRISYEVHGVAVFHPGLQDTEAPPVDLGKGRGRILVSPGGRWQGSAWAPTGHVKGEEDWGSLK